MFWVQHNFIFSSVSFKYTFIDSKKFTVKPKYISIKPRVSRYRWTRRSWHVWQLRKPSANVSTGLFLNQNLIKLNCIITLTNYTLITEDFLVEKHKSCQPRTDWIVSPRSSHHVYGYVATVKWCWSPEVLEKTFFLNFSWCQTQTCWDKWWTIPWFR